MATLGTSVNASGCDCDANAHDSACSRTWSETSSRQGGNAIEKTVQGLLTLEVKIGQDHSCADVTVY